VYLHMCFLSTILFGLEYDVPSFAWDFLAFLHSCGHTELFMSISSVAPNSVRRSLCSTT
jgi:hypothetical protein